MSTETEVTRKAPSITEQRAPFRISKCEANESGCIACEGLIKSTIVHVRTRQGDSRRKAELLAEADAATVEAQLEVEFPARYLGLEEFDGLLDCADRRRVAALLAACSVPYPATTETSSQ